MWPADRSEEADEPEAPEEAEEAEEADWTFRDVLLITEGTEGPVAVPQLNLTFRPEGIDLHRSDGERAWRTSWSELEELSASERSVLPDGGDGVVIVVVERDRHRRHRFILPTADPGRTEASLRALARAHGVRTKRPRPAVSPLLTAAVVVAAVATLTVLLLSAAHVIHL